MLLLLLLLLLSLLTGGVYLGEMSMNATWGQAIGPFLCKTPVNVLSDVVCFNHKGSFTSIINTRYACNATSERGTQTRIEPATSETIGKSRNHSATTGPMVMMVGPGALSEGDLFWQGTKSDESKRKEKKKKKGTMKKGLNNAGRRRSPSIK